jgi:hypothetical protein
MDRIKDNITPWMDGIFAYYMDGSEIWTFDVSRWEERMTIGNWSQDNWGFSTLEIGEFDLEDTRWLSVSGKEKYCVKITTDLNNWRKDLKANIRQNGKTFVCMNGDQLQWMDEDMIKAAEAAKEPAEDPSSYCEPQPNNLDLGRSRSREVNNG